MDLITPAVTFVIGLLIGMVFWWQANQQRTRDALAVREELGQLRRQAELRQAELASARAGLAHANTELVQAREQAQKTARDLEQVQGELAVTRGQLQRVSKENDTLKIDVITLQSVRAQNEQLKAQLAVSTTGTEPAA